MNSLRRCSPTAARSVILGAAVALLFGSAASVFGQTPKRKNPTSKVYVSDVSGEALIDTGETVEDLSRRSVYNAEGAVIETKRPTSEGDRSKHFSTMVYSNGTGAFFDADTRVEVRRFVQEPFTPTRTDADVEPSVSQTQAFVSRGAVGLCTSKLVAGSNMTYQTSLGSVTIRGQKVVIEAQPGLTKISMLHGDSTVRGGPQDLGGHTLHAGEQAIIRAGRPGHPNVVEIQRIPPAELPQLDEKVTMACMAKKTVYFETREKTTSTDSGPGRDNEVGNGGGTEGGGGDGSVTAFDSTSGTSSVVVREIVPVEVVPINLPVQFTVSPATIITPNGNVVTPGQGNPGPGNNPGNNSGP